MISSTTANKLINDQMILKLIPVVFCKIINGIKDMVMETAIIREIPYLSSYLVLNITKGLTLQNAILAFVILSKNNLKFNLIFISMKDLSCH